MVMATEDPKGKLTIVSDCVIHIMSYLNDEFKLSSEYEELNGLKFSELKNQLKNRIEDANIQISVIDAVRGMVDTHLVKTVTKIISY